MESPQLATNEMQNNVRAMLRSSKLRMWEFVEMWGVVEKDHFALI